MNVETLRDVVSRLNQSASALAALGAVLEARSTGRALDRALEPHLEGVLEALDVRESIRELNPVEVRSLLGEIRTFALTNTKLLYATSPGWTHAEAELLQAAGDVSATFPHALKRVIAPKLEGLAARLESPGASFLDIGVGVAALSIEMARLWPSLRVVGIEPWEPAITLARENVRAAGLDERIELRHQAGEELSESAAFDLVWLPSAFVPEKAVAPIALRAHRALRPGGWLIFAGLARGADDLTSALARLRTALFGGFVTTPEQIEELLDHHGFVEVRALPAAAGAVTTLFVARRAE